MKKQWNPRLLTLAVLVTLPCLYRLLLAGNAPWANFTMAGGLALFVGYYFQNKYLASAMPLIALALTDVFLSLVLHQGTFFYRGWHWVYGTFFLIVWLGRAMPSASVKNFIGAAVASSLLHWIVTDLGEWLGGGLDISAGKPLTRDWHGLLQCYWQAIPFIRNFFVSTVIFGGLFFGVFEFLVKK
ncbi:MAG: hypothetical protein CRN43_09440, partial [Candidatus Nephrothrix sp. EaCA]